LNYQFPEAPMPYTHLSPEERYQIHSLLDLLPIADIAKRLGRHASTIRRELAHGRDKYGYRPHQAQILADLRSRGSRNAVRIAPSLWQQVDHLLREQHSPEQIAGCLPISHETVYQHVYADPTGQLKAHLRCQKKRRKRYASGASRRGQIPNRRGIQERSDAVETRNHIGHWEADTMIGKAHKGALVTLVERKSGLVLIKKVAFKRADLVSQAMIDLLTPIQHMVATITYDNGKEFAMHERVNTAIGCESFFADPYCSWQRGSNENTNGLIRQYVPKGRHFATVTNKEVQMIQNKLNNRPRKRLKFTTPNLVFYNCVKRRALRA
jgi:transposase, IS30 family